MLNQERPDVQIQTARCSGAVALEESEEQGRPGVSTQQKLSRPKKSAGSTWGGTSKPVLRGACLSLESSKGRRLKSDHLMQTCNSQGKEMKYYNIDQRNYLLGSHWGDSLP